MTDFNEDQIKAALIKSNGWNGGGVLNTALTLTYSFSIDTGRNINSGHNRIYRTLILLFSMIFLFVSFDVASKEQPDTVFKFINQSDPVFEFQDRYRGQTVYSLKIYEDGKVLFRGNTYLSAGKPVQPPVLGERYSQITRQQVNELSKAFLALPFKELKKYEEKTGFFEGGINLIFFRSTYVHIDMIERLFFEAMMTKIKKITDIQKWVCYPEGHPQYSKHCLEDLPDDFQF